MFVDTIAQIKLYKPTVHARLMNAKRDECGLTITLAVLIAAHKALFWSSVTLMNSL